MASNASSSSVENGRDDGPQGEGSHHRGLASLLTYENRSQWSDPQHWREACSSLTISDEQKASSKEEATKLSEVNAREAQRRRERLIEDGYALVDNSLGSDDEQDKLTQQIKKAIATLHEKHEHPATFVLLYDETWELARIARKTLSASTHSSNEFNFDILAWHANPREDKAGFSPHRDRQPRDVSCSFHKDDQAKYVTMWIALSDANPENSCLYVIPKQYDPGYLAGDDQPEDEVGAETATKCATEKYSDPMSRALSTKESFQSIRALPRRKGQSVIFTHRIMHWGSRGNPKSHIEEPRIAISFVSSDPSFERPYVSPKYFLDNASPPFRIRLLLVCAQLLIYYQRFDLPKECVRACYGYCKEHQDELEETYRQKVFVQFVKAMKEVSQGSEMKVVANDNVLEGKANVVDDEDAMLEEMLDAEAGGYGEFEDDYDELAGGREDGSATLEDGADDSSEEENVSFFGEENVNHVTKKRKVG